MATKAEWQTRANRASELAHRICKRCRPYNWTSVQYQRFHNLVLTAREAEEQVKQLED